MPKLAHILVAVCALSAAAARVPPSIPVAILLDEPKPEIKANEVAQDEIQRPVVDLRNPGPPQRQEHETQNPETYLEQAAKLFSVKDNIERTQDLLRQGFKGVSDDIQGWISNSDQLSLIQQNIQNLRDSFTNQIQKLNETLQGFVELPALPPPAEPTPAESQIKEDFQKIESRLQILEDNFKSGVNTLSEGVQLVAHLKSSESLRQTAPASPVSPVSPAAPSPPVAPVDPPQNMLVQYVDYLQSTFTNGVNNVSQSIGQFFTNNPAVNGLQNFFNRNQTGTASPAPLADTPDDSTRPPFPWQNWGTNIQNQFNQIFALGQQGQQGSGSNPGSSQGLLQGLFAPITNLFPNRPGVVQPVAPVQPVAAGSNSVPAKETPPDPVEDAQPAAAEAAPATLPPAPVGPIRQILNNIPVVQRIQNQIQAAAANTDKPRDTVKSENVESEKGGILLIGKPPHNHNHNHNHIQNGVTTGFGYFGLNDSVPSADIPQEPSEDAPTTD